MTTAIIVQARMGSSRLPGKVLLPIMGRPMLSYQIERLRRMRHPNRLVIATTVEGADDRIAGFCDAEGIECFRGSEQDVLSRYCLAARRAEASTIVRVTSDCPLLDPALVDHAIDKFFEPPGCDYLSNMLQPTWPYGMAVEVFTRAALEEAFAHATDPQEREHVTPYIYWRPERFRQRSLVLERDLSDHRWTVDTPADFELVSRILTTLYAQKPDFGMDDVLALLDRHATWPDINRHVEQKKLIPTTTKEE